MTGNVDIQNWRRVIFFRSARLRDISKMLEAPSMRELAPDRALVIAQEGVAGDDLEKVFGPCEVAYIPPARFKLGRVSPGLIRRLKNFRADSFIIPYNNGARHGYRHIEWLGRLLRGPRVIGIDQNGGLHEVSLKASFARKKKAVEDRLHPWLWSHPKYTHLLFPKPLYPKTLSIDFSLTCNLRCMFCPKDDFKGPHLDLSNLKKLKTPIYYANTIAIGGRGEPLLHPKLGEAMRYIYSVSPKKDIIELVTNGTVLSKEKARLFGPRLKRMVISLNSADPVSYRKYMKYDLDKTLERIREFMEALDDRKTGKALLNFVTHSENYREMPSFVRLARELGIGKVEFNPYQVTCKEHLRYALFNTMDEYNDILDAARAVGRELGVIVQAWKFNCGEVHAPERDAQCPFLYNDAFISVNGEATPCCYSGSYVIGNVYESGFEKVWFGPQYQKLRKEKYLDHCKNGCVPFLQYEDYKRHFFADFKESEEYREIERQFEKAIFRGSP
ncbi:MAG TPA: radical SAM protein [Nitrospirae bacterium]|nr:radical SAM protein [Nitrospirota bacterium]